MAFTEGVLKDREGKGDDLSAEALFRNHSVFCVNLFRDTDDCLVRISRLNKLGAALIYILSDKKLGPNMTRTCH